MRVKLRSPEDRPTPTKSKQQMQNTEWWCEEKKIKELIEKYFPDLKKNLMK